MNKEEVKGLAKKFLDGTATTAEKKKLHSWSALEADESAEVVFTDKPEHAEDVKARMFNRIQAKINPAYFPAKHKSTSFKLWYRISVAAAIFCIAGVSIYFYTNGTIRLFNNHLADAKNIAVGKNTAMLTLSNGKQINLSDVLNGQLAEESGVSINKTSDGELVYEIKELSAVTGKGDDFNTISTPNAGQYKIVLPDGSRVWLNSASSLKFPATFVKADQRKVQLKGEAYFEVAKDKSHPFIVHTEKQKVEVLGTHFNIDAYNDDNNTKTTLLEGSISVAMAGYGNEMAKEGTAIVLKPGQQSILSDIPIHVVKADTEEAVAWKNGYFKFNSEPIASVMSKLARWYDVQIVYEGEISKDRFGGTISRYKNIADVLEMLESTKLVKFKVEGRKIIVR